MKNKFIVYILRCSDNSYYTGYTNDLKKRLNAHQNRQGSKYVNSRLPFKLVYLENYSTKPAAMKREYAIKRLSRQEKIKVIKS